MGRGREFHALRDPALLTSLNEKNNADTQTILDRLTGIEDRTQEANDARFIEGSLGAAEHQRIIGKLLAERDRLRAQLAERTAPTISNPDAVVKAWPQMSVPERNEVARILFASITVHPVGRGKRHSPESLTYDLAWS